MGSLYIAYNTATGTYADNSECTGIAYAMALDAAVTKAGAGGLSGKQTAVLGLGPVGLAAVKHLLSVGAEPVVFDPDVSRLEAAEKLFPVETAKSLEDALAQTPYIIDATPVGDIIGEEFITAETLVACPGVPCGLTAGALEKISALRFLHDPLQLGVAVMAVRQLWNILA